MKGRFVKLGNGVIGDAREMCVCASLRNCLLLTYGVNEVESAGCFEFGLSKGLVESELCSFYV